MTYENEYEITVRAVGEAFTRSAEACLRVSLAITGLSAIGDLEPQESPSADIEKEGAWARATELQHVLTLQGPETLLLWANLAQASAQYHAKAYPNGRPHIAHLLIRRIATAALYPEKRTDLADPSEMGSLAVAFVLCNGEGERPLESLLEAVAQRGRAQARAAHAMGASVPSGATQ